MLLVALATAFCVVPANSAEATGTGSAVQQDGIKVTGTVADAIGGVAGASVMIDGTSTGTITDLDGRYTIDTKTGDVLVFSCIGYKTVKVIVTTQAVINVTLEEDTTLLEEVVVTALGVKRDRKALGYGVAEVKGMNSQLPRRPMSSTLLPERWPVWWFSRPPEVLPVQPVLCSGVTPR